MNLARVAVLGLLLSSPALYGLYAGTVDPDVAGIRLGIALVVAAVVDRLARVFVSAVAPTPARVGREAAGGAGEPAEAAAAAPTPADRRR